MTDPQEECASSPDTGELDSSIVGREPMHTITHFLGPYKVLIRITEDGRFVDVIEVQANKDFLSVEQRIESSASYDVSDLYED